MPSPAPSDGLDDPARVLTALLRWVAEGHRCAIATVVRTWGSAPRSAGSHLVVREDGLFEGSVSGGCVEGDVIVAAQRAIVRERAELLDYDVADAQAWDVGLACGGRIQILVQPASDAGFPLPLARHLLAERREGRIVRVVTDLDSGRSVAAGDAEAERDGLFRNVHAPPLRLAVVGAVHIAQALLPMARIAGYAPLLIDPRAAFAARPRFSGEAVDEGWPDEALARWRPDASSAIVALTHDPKLDDPALAAALRSDAFYIGALGSRRNHAGRLERLAARGFPPEALARIHGPVGLSIGAANPAEIAVSILAEMTAALRLSRR